MKISSLKELFTDIMQDTYQAEKQMIEMLPLILNSVTSADLKDVLQDHLMESEEHIARLEKIFSILNVSPLGKVCKAMEGLISEAKDVFTSTENKQLFEAHIIAALQKIEHYEIASYGTLRTYAEQLDLEDIADLLEETLEEEKAADERLTEIAEGHVNEDAENA